MIFEILDLMMIPVVLESIPIVDPKSKQITQHLSKKCKQTLNFLLPKQSIHGDVAKAKIIIEAMPEKAPMIPIAESCKSNLQLSKGTTLNEATMDKIEEQEYQTV